MEEELLQHPEGLPLVVLLLLRKKSPPKRRRRKSPMRIWASDCSTRGHSNVEIKVMIKNR